MSRSLQDRLSALQKSISTAKRTEDSPSVDPNVELGVSPRLALDELGFCSVTTDEGTYWRRELRYDILTVHGQNRFAGAAECAWTALAKVSKSITPDIRLVRFYDTETTGLGTGAGTMPFLHAVGQFEDDEFAVYQYFLDDYAEEYAMLRALLAHHFASQNTVVSFNGKSFDWPMFRSRLAMYRLDAPGCQQIDLLYPSRRLWKHDLPRVTLSCVEEAVLGLKRVDDLPGKEAPSRYFTYIENRDASLVSPVLEHNAMDVCSLVTLTEMVCQRLECQQDVQTSGEWLALGRLYDEWSEYDLADRCFTASVEAPDVTWKAKWLKSLYHKRRGQWAEASHLWTQMAEQYPLTLSPIVELAKYCEHRTKDLPSARTWARMGLERTLTHLRHRVGAQNGNLSSPGEDVVLTSLRKRIARIERKMQAHAGGELR